MDPQIPNRTDWDEAANKLRIKDDQLKAQLVAYAKIPEDDYENRINSLTSLRELAARAARLQKDPKATEFLASIEKAADLERGKTGRAQKAAKDAPDETISTREAEQRIRKIKFSGLLLNRDLADVEEQTILNALRSLRECPNKWHEGTGTHFVQMLKKRGANCGITTAAHLNRAIQAGHSKPGKDGKWVHHLGKAKIVYNPAKWVLISFVP